MERNVMGELNMYRQLGIKPNFTEIGRKYGLHRHTVAKHWAQGEEIEDRRHDKASGFDAFRETIERKAELPGITKRAIYEFLLDRHPDAALPGYGAFTKYCRARGIECSAHPEQKAHPRFETPPGRQLQFDWKEGLEMVDVNGEIFEFNVFSAVLGYSRAHRFIYSRTRTEDDLLACLLATFVRFGGIPEEAITDNMGALASFREGKRVRSERAWRFAREAGFELKLCKVRTPETKGKDESANRFVNRLRAYDRDFEGEQGIIDAIARIEARSNSEPNETTGLPPAALFPAPHWQPPAPAGDGRRRVRAEGPRYHARARRGAAVVGSPLLHRAGGPRRDDAVRPDPRHPRGRDGRGPRRIRARPPHKLRRGPLRRGPVGEGVVRRLRHPGRRAREPEAARRAGRALAWAR